MGTVFPEPGTSTGPMCPLRFLCGLLHLYDCANPNVVFLHQTIYHSLGMLASQHFCSTAQQDHGYLCFNLFLLSLFVRSVQFALQVSTSDRFHPSQIWKGRVGSAIASYSFVTVAY